MRLLLDEMYSPAIAKQLRDEGHDVHSVHDRPALEGVSDGDLFELMRQERRAILTEDAAGFVPLARQAAAEGGDHRGILLAGPASMPRSDRTIGAYVAALAAGLSRHSSERALLNQTLWLAPASARG